MLAVAGAFVLLSSSLLPQSRLLRLRGGSAVPATASPVTSQEAQPQGPLRLQLVAGSNTAVVRVPRVELSSANVAALQLQPGARVRIARAHKRTDKPAWRPANPFQKPIPDATLGELREAEAPTPLQPYVLGDGEARLPSKAMQAMRLQAGDTVLVAPVARPTARPAGSPTAAQAGQAGQAPIQRRRSGGFLNNVIMFNYMMGGGYGGGYGRRRSSYGHRGRSYRRVRSSYGGRRRY